MQRHERGEVPQLFANAIEKAKTIDELTSIGLGLRFWADDYYNRYSPDHPLHTPIKSEAEFFERLATWKAWSESCQVTSAHDGSLREGPARFSLSYDGYDDRIVSNVLARARKAAAPQRQPRAWVEVDRFFVLVNSSGYLVRYLARGYKYTSSETGGKKFGTDKQASAYLYGLVAKHSHHAETWKVTPIDRHARIKV